jgi:hypothetical protein
MHPSLLLSLFWRFSTLLQATFLTALLLFSSGIAAAELAQPVNDQAWSFSKPLQIDDRNLSGVVVTADFMALASDEGQQIELFQPSDTHPHSWQSAGLITLNETAQELDIEALAWQAPYLYAIGSHGLKRKKLKSDLSQKKNAQRLQHIVAEPARAQLFRVELGRNLTVRRIETLSLTTLLHQDPLLHPFSPLPSKENGIDIEGLAVDPKGRLWVGFRGPVLRGNTVPVLRLTLNSQSFTLKKHQWRFLHTENGGGIRGLSEIDDGFLVLSGAVGDQAVPFQVSWWSGQNALKGKDAPQKALRTLCTLPQTAGNPEAIQMLRYADREVTFLIVHDGPPNGQPTVFRCATD